MANLNDIINLAKSDGGKFFVMDEQGEVKLVIMNIEDYQRVLLHKLQKQVEDVEKINREITKAQLQEPSVQVSQSSFPHQPFPNRANERFPEKRPNHNNYQDLREEVIDPSFDFEIPKVDDDI